VKAQLKVPGITIQLRDSNLPVTTEHYSYTHEHLIALSLRSMPARSRISPTHASSDARFFKLGSLYSLPPHLPVVGRSDGGDYHYVACSFDSTWFARKCGRPLDFSDPELKACCDIKGTRLQPLMLQLAQEVQAPGLAAETMVEGLGLAVSAEFLRYLQRERSPLPEQGRLVQWQLRRITEFVEASECGSPTIAQLAQLCNISERHLMRLFKRTTGATLHHFIEATRLNHAKKLLSETDMQIKAIALQLGFSASNSFAAAFRRLTDIAPAEYRRRFGTARSHSL
jgi:AraC family transcriptional regulator